jgi:hypothetical protein
MLYRELLDMYPIPCWVETPNGVLRKIENNKITVSKYHLNVAYLDGVLVFDNGKYATISSPPVKK